MEGPEGHGVPVHQLVVRLGGRDKQPDHRDDEEGREGQHHDEPRQPRPDPAADSRRRPTGGGRPPTRRQLPDASAAGCAVIWAIPSCRLYSISNIFERKTSKAAAMSPTTNRSTEMAAA